MEIKKIEELEEKINDDKLTVIDFYATWCGPCKMLAPIFESLSNKINDVNFVKVNVDDFDQISSQFNISSIPTLIFIKDQKPVDRIVGFISEADLERKILEHK